MGFAAAGGRTHGSQVQRASSPTNCPLMLSHHEWARQTILRAQRQGPAELLRLRPYTHDLQACHVASASRSSARFQIAVHFSQENNKFSEMTFAVTVPSEQDWSLWWEAIAQRLGRALVRNAVNFIPVYRQPVL